MHLIAGLGNPGAKFEKTRHNLGFRVVDLLAKRWGFDRVEARFDGEVSKGKAHGHPVILLKPQTFMNLSGTSIAAAARYQKIAPEHVWVIHDDLDLPLGQLRIRTEGSSGGHNGVQSVIERLGTPKFVRFRIGVGRPASAVPTEDYVLQPFGADERETAQAMVEKTAEAVGMALQESVTRAMNVFNR
ncbi:MAG TPA: aminoacyl-tRNA hydrolase [Candidatus Baltobacteraceae bacterium]|nr:aminoacyl-tRNA hydrolase [Candidatus Baltobacteraceae bacterium]